MNLSENLLDTSIFYSFFFAFIIPTKFGDDLRLRSILSFCWINPTIEQPTERAYLLILLLLFLYCINDGSRSYSWADKIEASSFDDLISENMKHTR